MPIKNSGLYAASKMGFVTEAEFDRNKLRAVGVRRTLH